jgi:hypothetical protein
MFLPSNFPDAVPLAIRPCASPTGFDSVGEPSLHRHQYAQERYRELTGWSAPAVGGPRSRELTREQKAIDREARLTISSELGHEREQVTAIYLGR